VYDQFPTALHYIIPFDLCSLTRLSLCVSHDVKEQAGIGDQLARSKSANRMTVLRAARIGLPVIAPPEANDKFHH
jgi:hypothetical protein